MSGFCDQGANYEVRTLAIQADGQILVGGGFSELNGLPCAGIGRLKPEGTLDSTFAPSILLRALLTTDKGTVRAFKIQSDGKIVIIGHFSEIGGHKQKYLARLNHDGTTDTSFNPQINGLARLIDIQEDGKILLGGEGQWFGGFSKINNHKCGNLVRLNPDGTRDSTFNPRANHGVYALKIQKDGKILVGGGFQELPSQPGSSFISTFPIARLDVNGSIDSTFSAYTDTCITSLALQTDGKILAAGDFNVVNKKPPLTRDSQCICRLNPDGMLDETFSASAGYLEVKEIVSFEWEFAKMATGRATPRPAINAVIEQTDGKIIVGGNFTKLNEMPCNRVGRLNPDGTTDTSFNLDANGPVKILAMQADGKLVIAGDFTKLGGKDCNRIGRLDIDGCIDAM
jgi:uncharacterized delta-60 repeat protein